MDHMATGNPFTDTKRRPHIEGPFYAEEVPLANRNSGILLEALRHDVTPVGMHYLLNHFDVPYVAERQLAGGGGRLGAAACQGVRSRRSSGCRPARCA